MSQIARLAAALTLSLLLVGAAPLRRGRLDNSPADGRQTAMPELLRNFVGCPQPPLSAIPLPEGQANVTLDASAEAVFRTTVSRGAQNYTCTGGVYVSVGAVADLYDISCLATIASDLVTELPAKLLKMPIATVSSTLPVMMSHFFAATPFDGAGISPAFADTPNGDVFSVYQKAGVLAAPNATHDVPWLRLEELEEGPGGGISTTCYRLATAGGQPPKTCATEGEPLSVDYAALYYFVQ